MSPLMFEVLFAGTLGVLVGSFLNVVISRVPARMMWMWREEARAFLEEEGHRVEMQLGHGENPPEGIVMKRSFCPSCHHAIAAYDNIPLLSYVVLRGRCRHCQQHISWQYPLVELLMGVLAAAAVVRWGWTPQALAGASFFAVLVAGSGIDWHTKLLPDQLVLPALWGALAWSMTPWATLTPAQSLTGAMVGYGMLWSVFWLFKIVTGKEGMGYGDFKWLALIGAFLGPMTLVPVVLVASVSGALVGLVLRWKLGESQPFAFGPYLALGAVVCALNPSLTAWLLPGV